MKFKLYFIPIRKFETRFFDTIADKRNREYLQFPVIIELLFYYYTKLF